MGPAMFGLAGRKAFLSHVCIGITTSWELCSIAAMAEWNPLYPQKLAEQDGMLIPLP